MTSLVVARFSLIQFVGIIASNKALGSYIVLEFYETKGETKTHARLSFSIP